ncbi:bath-42 [Symbiodinium sp. CCMP2592]|nr:bath-42 [Symbiodinium sp. CCMP2592]
MAETAEDLASLSCVLAACFGTDGNFTVIVEEHSADMLESSKEVEASVKRTEFMVWSSLLARWSPVFEKMVGSDNYAESQKSQVVIQDFSASAVEIFLRFLYSGSVRGSIPALVEVAALADKYQVEELCPLCLRLVRKALPAHPQVACEVLAVADRFHVAEMQANALDVIFTQPKKTLLKRPALRQELLEEILGSGLLCIEADALKEILRSWGTKDCDSLESLINIRASSQHSDDVLFTLLNRYEKAGKKGVFLGAWVVVSLGPGQGEAYTLEQLNETASNEQRFTVNEGWVQWLLPHTWVHLQGFSFEDQACADNDEEKLTSASFRIWCSEDCATWHLAYESQEQEISYRTFLPCKRPPGLVKSFKLEVLEGELSHIYFNIHGILQTSV